MRLYLVRHAESLRNQGKEHDKLSDTGVEQAKRLGLFLKDKHIDYIYCSNLIRAKETIKYILKNLKVKKGNIIYSNDFNEQDLGIFEEKAAKEWYFHILDLKEKGVDLLNYKPEKGESLLETEKRAQKVLEFLNKKHKFNEHILIVSHCNFLKLLVTRLLKLPISEIKYFNIFNASLSTFELDKNFNVKNFEIDEFKHLLMFSSYIREIVERV